MKILSELDNIKISWWEEHILWNLEALWEKITAVPKEIKWFVQRGRKGYADCDVWEFDSYLAQVISGGLKELSKNQYGSPVKFRSQAEWGKWLLKMSKLYGKYETYDFKTDKEHNKYMLELSKLFDNFGDLWD